MTAEVSADAVAALKAQGNTKFQQKEYPEAIALFTEAIEADPTAHVLYSNRSACHAALKQYDQALVDARRVVELAPQWAKGFSRLGAALFGLGQHTEAIQAYQDGLKIEPGNELLQRGVQDVEAAMAGEQDFGLGSMFDASIWGKMAANPKLAPLLSQPDFVQKIQAIQQNPKSINQYLQDPRMMNLVMGMMGLDATATTDPSEFERNRAEAQGTADSATSASPPKKAKEPEPVPVPAPPKELTEEEKVRQASDALKEQGNKAYKARKFDEALALYQQAWEADATNIAVLTNKSAVLFEMGALADTPARDAECLACSEEAVEKGREVRADFKLIARAFSRMAAVYQRQGDLDQAIKYYEKSLSEHRAPDTLAKLKEAEKAKAEAAKRAYHDPVLADQAREEGNELFKASKFAEAVKCYTEAIKRNDTDPRNYSNRAACYTKLMALPEADKDCDSAIALDAGFVKAYIRKAAIQMAKRDFPKALELCTLAKEKDVEGKHTAEIDGQMYKCYAGMNANQMGASGESKEEVLRRAQQDPQVQSILADPAMQLILQQMQQDPAAAQEHMRNPAIAAKIRVLINAGIIQTR